MTRRFSHAETLAKQRKLVRRKGLRVVRKNVRIFVMDSNQIKQRIDSAIELLLKLREEIAATEAKLPPEAQLLYDSGICLFCKEKFAPGEKPHRGLHEHEHRKILRRIEKNEVTEGELITQGLLAPPKPAGRKTVSVFEEARQISEAKAAVRNAEAKLQKKRSKNKS